MLYPLSYGRVGRLPCRNPGASPRQESAEGGAQVCISAREVIQLSRREGQVKKVCGVEGSLENALAQFWRVDAFIACRIISRNGEKVGCAFG